MSERSRDLVRAWYACAVTSGYEIKVRDQLMNLTSHPIWKDYIFDIYVPTEKYKTKQGKIKERVIEGYKTYMYIEMILTDELYALIKIDGFRTPLPAKDPTPLPKEEVARIMDFREKMENMSELED